MNSLTTLNIDVHAYKLRQVFDDYNMVTSYPINREQFVKDVLKAAMPDKVYVFDAENNLVNVETDYL